MKEFWSTGTDKCPVGDGVANSTLRVIIWGKVFGPQNRLNAVKLWWGYINA